MNLIRLAGVTLALTTCCLVSAQSPPDDAYGESLRAWIKVNLYDGMFNDQGYSPIREAMYSYIDEQNDSIECIYSGFKQLAEVTTFPDPINAEHIIPQSWFGSASPMRSDVFNLRPSHQSANSSRANYPFGEVDDASATWYGVEDNMYFSTSTEPAASAEFSERFGSLWEPRESKKGDVARQVFYFYTMYPTQAGPFENIGDIIVLYNWHLNDPVDAQEIQRNNRAEEIQGNRNPYVDQPDWVYLAWIYTPVHGCVYETATNYNPLADLDDGTCVFAPACLEDLSGDGVINTPDLLILMAAFGNLCE